MEINSFIHLNDSRIASKYKHWQRRRMDNDTWYGNGKLKVSNIVNEIKGKVEWSQLLVLFVPVGCVCVNPMISFRLWSAFSPFC